MNPELQLRDIHLPPEPSWWPPAPGWWLLALLAALAVGYAARWALRHWRARQRRRAMQAEFEQVLRQDDPHARLAALSALLRRAARLRDPAAAGLTGAAWLSFLDQSAPGEAPFTRGPGQLLVDGLYRKDLNAAAVNALLEPARRCYWHLVGRP